MSSTVAMSVPNEFCLPIDSDWEPQFHLAGLMLHHCYTISSASIATESEPIDRVHLCGNVELDL